MSSTNPRYRNTARRTALRKRVLAAYDICALCGKPVDKTLPMLHPMSAVVDEIIPVSRGGDPLAWNNVQLTHRCCNRIKSNHSNEWAKAKLREGKTNANERMLKATSLPFKTTSW